MSEQTKQVSDFYDKFWARHEEQGISKPISRHRTIFKNLKKVGLTPGSTVLEIGCGIGSLSQLVIKYLTNGYFVGADISPQTIDILKKRYPNRDKVDFVLTDMSDFNYPKKFDFVLFPDVLEHIPVEAHEAIFKNLHNLIHPNSVILINNPEPMALEWIIKNRPHELQIIDQPLHANHFGNLAYSTGYYIEKIEPYALYTQQYDYQNIIIKPFKELKSVDPKTRPGFILTNIKSRL